MQGRLPWPQPQTGRMQRRRVQGQLTQRLQWQLRPGRQKPRRPSRQQRQLRLWDLWQADSRQATPEVPSCQSLCLASLKAQAAATSQHNLLPVSFAFTLINSAWLSYMQRR